MKKIPALDIVLGFVVSMGAVILIAFAVYSKNAARESQRQRVDALLARPEVAIAQATHTNVFIPATNAGVWLPRETNEPKVLKSDMNPPVWLTITDAIDPTLKPGDRLIVDEFRNIVRDTNSARSKN